MHPKEVEALITIPFENASTAVRASEASFIHEFLSKHPNSQTLEIGFGLGRSACYIIAATGKPHIVIDPFQDNYNYQALKNIEACGFRSKLTFIEDLSHNVLPKLGTEGLKFDFIFIDGEHKFDGLFIDFYYSDLLLKQNGYILLHDTWMRSTQLVMSFMKKNRRDYRQLKISQNNMALFQKVGNDVRDGMYFREFYTANRIIKHAFLQWISNPRKSALKSLILHIKEWIKPTSKR